MNCRRVADRPRDPANWNGITDVLVALSIPVIANGDVFEYEDIQRLKESTGRLKTFDSAIDVSSVLWYLYDSYDSRQAALAYLYSFVSSGNILVYQEKVMVKLLCLDN